MLQALARLLAAFHQGYIEAAIQCQMTSIVAITKSSPLHAGITKRYQPSSVSASFLKSMACPYIHWAKGTHYIDPHAYDL